MRILFFLLLAYNEFIHPKRQILDFWEPIEYAILLKREYLHARNILKRHHEFDEAEGVTKEIIASERLKLLDLQRYAESGDRLKGNHRV